MSRAPHSIAAQRGYSLLEVLVAFAILALSVTTILSLFATGLRNTTVSGDYARAVSLAESRLADYQGMDAMQLDVRTRSGEEGDLVWQARVTPYDERPLNRHGTRLYQVDVTVSWAEGGRARTVSLSTLRLGAAP